MKTSVKFLCVSLLLCAAVACMLFSAVGTIRAYQQLQQNHQRILAGDITTVDSWMTLPYVARVYHVPEACLYPALHLPDTWTVRHSTLRSLADRYKRPVDKVIHDVQRVIISYRSHHSMCGPPASPAPKTASFRQHFSFVARKGAFYE